MNAIRPRSLSSRLIFIFILVTLPLLIILILVSNYAKSVVVSQVGQSYQNFIRTNLQIIDKSLDDTLVNMIYIVNQDENFQELAKAGLTDSELYFAQMGLQQKNASFQSYFQSVDLFLIYSVPNDHLFLTSGQQSSSAVNDQAILETITSSLKNEETIQTYLYKWNIVQIGGQPYLYRLISNDIDNKVYIGALVNMDNLQLPLQELQLGESGDIMFVDHQGHVLSRRLQSENILEGVSVEQLRSGESFSVQSEDGEMLVVSGSSSSAPISLIVAIPKTSLLEKLPYFQSVIYFLPLLVVMFLLFYILCIRLMLMNPIFELLRVIRRVKSGDMTARLRTTKSADFETIYYSFNHMIEEINELKIHIYEEKLRTQKAEFNQLQSQINPHFFLNTLNIIFQLADMKRYDLVKRTVQYLVQYFRFLMINKRDTITMGQELAHIRNYLEIQKMRYQDLFEFECRIDEELREMKVPSLIVQPFVENAMIHGFSIRDNQPFRLEVDIRTIRSEYSDSPGPDLIRIEVRDNGKGFLQEQMDRSSLEERAQAADEGHIGIWNVRRRLAVAYGAGRSELVLMNSEPGGALIRILIPFIDLEGEEA